jgi:hypothetical protein
MPTETLRPNASGDSTQLAPVGDSPNYKCVDEAVSDGDSTYVQSSTENPNPLLDLYGIEDTSIPAGSTINSVTVYILCRSTSPTYRATFRAALKKAGGTVQYGGAVFPSTTYTLYSASFTGISQADLNNLQIGVEITSGSNELLYTGRCTQVYVVIDYTPPAVAIRKPIMDGLVYVE